jgi:hypothetical protein
MSRPLGRIYLARVAVAFIWVVAVGRVGLSARPGAAVSVLAALLLVAYPAADLVASIADARTDAGGRATAAQRANAAVDAVAVVAIAVAASAGLRATMDAFAGWAVLSGAIQIVVAGRRLGRLRGQWLMLISGGGSIFAGTTFVDWSRSPSAALHTLAQYSTGGALWYGLTAVWLLLPVAVAPHVQEP